MLVDRVGNFSKICFHEEDEDGDSESEFDSDMIEQFKLFGKDATLGQSEEIPRDEVEEVDVNNDDLDVDDDADTNTQSSARPDVTPSGKNQVTSRRFRFY